VKRAGHQVVARLFAVSVGYTGCVSQEMWRERLTRVNELEHAAKALLDEVIETEVTREGKRLAGVVVLFSGGNDSTTVAHLFRRHVTHAAHANTGIGIEETRQFVRDTCETWGIPLLEKHTQPGFTYRDMVLRWGFPGPSRHSLMYRRLKERPLREAVRELVANPRQERVVFLSGRRASESARRSKYAGQSPVKRDGSVVWVSPITDWTKMDLNTYRVKHPDVPRNQVSDTLHMSGECLCGSFAHPGELGELAEWYPRVADEIKALEREVAATGTVPRERCRWGWGRNVEEPSEVGEMCSSCDERFQGVDTLRARDTTVEDM
jgi:3'-phosphoadenosine 5'-phosphosulfate sulfotransferase (PAPS reductase)/FAD synthetase